MATVTENPDPRCASPTSMEEQKQDKIPLVPASPCLDVAVRNRKREIEQRFQASFKLESPAQPRRQSLTATSNHSHATPRQRARLLEQERLREFAAKLPSPIVDLSNRTEEEAKHEAQTPKKKNTDNKYSRKQGKNDPKGDVLIPSPPGLVSDQDTDSGESIDGVTKKEDQDDGGSSSRDGTELLNSSSSSNEEMDTLGAQLERFESVVRTYASNARGGKDRSKSRDLMRKVSVLRDQYGETEVPQAPTRKVSLLGRGPRRAKSKLWMSSKASRAAEKERMLGLLEELDTVEHAILRWSAVPHSSPRESLRQLTIFRISVMDSLEHHPLLMDQILVELTELENAIMDYKSKKQRNEWSRSKEAVRRISVLKLKLTQPDWDSSSKELNAGGSKSTPESDNQAQSKPLGRQFSLFGPGNTNRGPRRTASRFWSK